MIEGSNPIPRVGFVWCIPGLIRTYRSDSSGLQHLNPAAPQAAKSIVVQLDAQEFGTKGHMTAT